MRIIAFSFTPLRLLLCEWNFSPQERRKPYMVGQGTFPEAANRRRKEITDMTQNGQLMKAESVRTEI